MKSVVWKSVEGVKVKDRCRKRRKRGCRKRRESGKENTSTVAREKFTNRIDLASESRVRRREKNEIVNRGRRKENKTRVLRSEMISEKFKGHGNSPET